MSHYVIAGGAGFIGSHFVGSLLSEDHRVTVLDDMSTGTMHNLTGNGIANGWLNIVDCDVSDSVPDIPGVDVVAHFASIPTPEAYMEAPIRTLRTGADATRHLLDLATDSDARFLYASTSEVYGNPREHPQSESDNGNVDPYGPRSCYDESKRYGEALCRAYRDQHDTEVRVARIFNTYGPRMRDGRVIPAFVRQALAGDPLTVHGSGNQTRSFCYIDDLIRGLRALLDSSLTTPVNLGRPEEVSISHLARLVTEVCDTESAIVHTERPPDDPDRRRPDISLAQDQLNWSPDISLRDGLKKMKSWSEANRSTPLS